jgi:hypothetical protein
VVPSGRCRVLVAYVALVGILATLNILSSYWGDQDFIWWYVGLMALTLPTSVLALFPIMAVVGVVSDATGGGASGNAYSSVVAVLAFMAVAVLNAGLAWSLVQLLPSRLRRRCRLSPANS